jgi:chemotaxis protein histidine kinase CheA
VVVTVADDGAGLDEAALRERAAALGVGQGLAAEELAFVEGLSRQAHADALAGRGVGLAAVRADLARVGATVSLHRPPGGGVAITIRIPVA